MIDWLKKALSYDHKQQWNGSETIWLVKVTDPKRSDLYRTQGVYLSHHRVKAQVHMHCTHMGPTLNKPSSLMVFYLNSARDKWIANAKISAQYTDWYIAWGIELSNIEFLWNLHLAKTTI